MLLFSPPFPLLWKHRAALVRLPDLLEEHEILQRTKMEMFTNISTFHSKSPKIQTVVIKNFSFIYFVIRDLQWGNRLPWAQLSSSRPGQAGTGCRSCPCLWRPPSKGRSTVCWCGRWVCRHLSPSAAEQKCHDVNMIESKERDYSSFSGGLIH